NADDTTAKYDQIRSPDRVPAVQFTLECVDDDNSSEVEAVSFITDASSETRIDITEKSPELQSDTKFVRLSDLMCQPARLDSDVCNDVVCPRMSRSIPESSWVESPLLMSRSAGFRIAPRPMEPDTSSLSDSTGSQTGPSQRRLGTDLLRMFLEEMDTDTHVHVGNRSIKAHRCILISRCQYFAGTLRGRSIELDGFSYDAVHFALCHIYSGASHVPDSISLVELASLADLLSLEGLKEVVSHALKSRHCHNFHSPCAGCLTGGFEVLPLSSAYGLDELYQKCLKWITTHYLRIWPSRAFASLQRELREKCVQQHVVHMSAATVLATSLSCDRLLASLPNLKWAEPVVQLALQLSQTCQTYVTQHFTAVLPTLMDAEPWNYPRIEEILLNASSGLTLDQDCGVYSRCSHMLVKTKDSANVTLHEMLVKLKEHIERRIVLKSHKLGKCQRWLRMEPELRAHIKSLAKMSESLVKNTKTDIPSRLPRMISSKTVTSSSESSRNSSPATSQSHTSPSLRRSLLLAARAPQVPPSPSATRRISTLTMPTAASAAKSAPPRHNKPSNPKQQPQSLTQPRPISAPSNLRKSASSKSANKEPVVKKDTPRRPVNSAATRKPATPTASKKHTEISKSNEKIGVKRKQVVSTTTKKVVQAETKSPQKSPGMVRSSTFLKDEPTVLSLSSHGKM
ncbi:LOW QUALITY PROTEIN: BTB/POZ domain-containing protein 8-like, partial [Atheta coriaria]|uniref:LOW QUALITY PROTEIN: BTB/POZ domain-containing protein 8-like n=1 Tax=Dalotia coriaria TaxID=877792 RepID=UPI0031F3AF79